MTLFETERLIVRAFTPDDWKDLYEYLSDKEVLKFEPYEPFSEEQCREEAISRSQSSNFFAVCLKDNNKLIGNIYVQETDEVFKTWEIGYVFNQAFKEKAMLLKAQMQRLLIYSLKKKLEELLQCATH